MIERLLASFRQFPYENATKLVAGRRRTPDELLRDHELHRAGGTCFDLVNLFAKFALDAGLEPRLALADRTYGRDTHCAVIVGDFLCDPGYMQFEPLPLRDAPVEVDTAYNRVRIVPRENGWDVFTNAKFRYHLKSARVSEDDFIGAWERSFEFEMMNHLVTIVARPDRLIYLRDGHWHEFTRQGRVKRDVPPEAATELGLSRELVGRALATLR